MSPGVRHEQFLRRLATSELDPRSEEARRHLAECSGCSERWRAMSRLIEELESGDEERRAILTDLGEPSPRDVEWSRRAAAAAGVGSHAGPADAARVPLRAPSTSRSGILWIAAAAALLAALFVVRAWSAKRTPADDGTRLGAGDARIVDADGVLDAEGVTIEYPLAPMQALRIELEGWSPSRGERAVERQTITELRWRPDPTVLAQFTGPVVLRVQPLDRDELPEGASFERVFSLSP